MKRYIPFIFIGTVLFVAGGDKIFPGAVGEASTQARTTVNNFFVGLFPTWEPKTKPYERTEKELENIEKSK
ncbi:hypothetical protein WJM97_17430 [Okeanomitos corallinicola TIOX110]|uniref:Uncharacterized protein n=1 Tax=Okeanomitos corallinicola TIOX110 TaxID=3133117 RepID=A0ABZ2UUP4_9CYAN